MTKDQLEYLATLAECTIAQFVKYEPDVRYLMAISLCHMLMHVVLNSYKQSKINNGKLWKMAVKKEIDSFVAKQKELLEEESEFGKSHEDFLWKGRKLENENA